MDDRDTLRRIRDQAKPNARDWADIHTLPDWADEDRKHAWYEVLTFQFRDHADPRAWDGFAELNEDAQRFLSLAYAKWEKFPHRPRDN